MKKVTTLFLLMISCFAAMTQTSELQQFYTQAMEARNKGDNEKFYDYIMKAHAIHPYHQGILYQAGIAAALNKKNAEAIEYLKEAILIQSDFVLDIPELNALKGTKEFEHLKEIKKNASNIIITSDTAFTIKDRSLHLESITAAGENTFYGGSIHKRKIIKVENGVVSDFTKSGQDGLGSVFGVKVDLKRKILWACSSPMEEMEHYNAILPSAVFKYDLRTGKLLAKYLPENPALQLVLGEITINRKGEVYASDSKSNLIFKVNEATGKLEQFYSSDEFWNIQGITFSDDGDFLFIADYIKGIFRLDMKDLKLSLLEKNFDLSLKAVDGLTFYKNTLLAIQNYIKPMRVTQYKLNEELDKIISYKIIDQNHPAFHEPTLGSVIDDRYYYVANSQWSGYDDKHNIKPSDQLQDIVILRVDLRK
ncbi:MAG TPA: hypothetical protein VFW11_07645 [Cyclobacteriaceae bacterium]|nr:hypothetical protein [Cyclobacteriaceae bacterium]